MPLSVESAFVSPEKRNIKATHMLLRTVINWLWLFGMIKLKHLLAKWTNKDPSTSLSCTKGINNEVLSFIMWNSNTVVTWNDTYGSRTGKCRHSQNEPKLRSHNITEPYVKTRRALDGTIYERRITCHSNVEQ